MVSVTSWLVVIVTTIAIMAVKRGEALSMERMAKDIETTENIMIHHVTPEHIRQRRSLDGHPEQLHFDLHHGDNKVSQLRLQRLEDKGDKSESMRVYRVVNDRLWEVPESQLLRDVSNAPPQKDIGFWTDEDRLSLFRVRSSRRRLQAYDLEGTVVMNDREYIVSPNNEYLAVNESERAHKLCRLMKHLDYGLDALHDGNAAPPNRFQTRSRRPTRKFPWYARQYRSSRRRRQAEVTSHFVEVVFYCDFSCYTQFDEHTRQRRSTNETVYTTIRNHFTFIAKAMNLRYESISRTRPDQQILISANNLVVLDRSDLSEFTEANQAGGLVDARDAIIAFRSYIRGGNGVPRADHWMLFTAYDLSVNGNRNTIGIAYLNRICSDSSVSVIEEFFSGTTAQIATHELGHILGAEHDNAYGQCSDNNYNIMAGVAFFPDVGEKVQNPWRFSTCSAEVITDFITGPSGNCLKNRPARVVTSPDEAGQTFDADTQCQLSQGPTSFFCRGVQKERGLDKLCVRMYCYLPEEAPNCIGLVALDGTSCGDGKWCQRGSCVRGDNAPRIQNGNTCPQGDDPFYGCTQASCNDTDARYTFCCKTCGAGTNNRQIKPPPPPRAIPPIPMQTRAPRIESIDQILPPAPPPPPPAATHQRPQILNPSPQFHPRPFRRPVIVRRQPTPPTTPPPPPPPIRRPNIMAPWWRIPAPPPPPPSQNQQVAPRGGGGGGGSGGGGGFNCSTDLCRCLRSNSFATCLYRSWFTQGK